MIEQGRKTFRITANNCKTFWSPQRRTWLQSSLLTLCGPEIAPVFIDVFLTYHPLYITAPSQNYLVHPFTVCCHIFLLSENIVLLPLDWCLSTLCLPFLSYLAWLLFLPCGKMFVGMKKFFLPIIFCTFQLLVLLDRKCLFCYLPHMESSSRKKEWASLLVKAQGSDLGCSAPSTSEVVSYLPPVVILKSKHWTLLKIWFIQSTWWRGRKKELLVWQSL